MAHVRKQIRDAIAARLATDAALVGGRVYASRVYPLSEANIPCLAIYTTSESSGLRTMGSITMSREMDVQIDIVVRATDTFDDDVDAIAVQVEESIGADIRLGGLVKDIVLTATQIEYDGDAERPIGVASLTFSTRYVTSIEDVETAN